MWALVRVVPCDPPGAKRVNPCDESRPHKQVAAVHKPLARYIQCKMTLCKSLEVISWPHTFGSVLVLGRHGQNGVSESAWQQGMKSRLVGKAVQPLQSVSNCHDSRAHGQERLGTTFMISKDEWTVGLVLGWADPKESGT